MTRILRLLMVCSALVSGCRLVGPDGADDIPFENVQFHELEWVMEPLG